METSKGKHISQIVMKLGPPTNIINYKFGGAVYVWTQISQTSIPKYSLEIVPHDDSKNAPQITRGNMYWNPVFNRWEWTSTTAPDPLRPVRIIPKVRQKLTGYTTKSEGYQITFYVDDDETVVYGELKLW